MNTILRNLALVTLAITCSAVYGGSITGKVLYEGQIPKFKPVDTSGDPHCAAHAGDKPPVNEVLVLGEGRTMANILVKVVKGLPEGKTWEAPADAAEMTQKGCRYSPHVTAIQLGQKLKVLNPDGILHNVNCQPKLNKAANRAMPKNLKEIEFNFDKAEDPFRFKCDVHPWMMAYCTVVAHPFFDVTEKDGVFSIDGLEPGAYEIEAWHERLGKQTAKVTVSADKAGEANFTFTRPSRK
jgi:plastocyanin